jgi:hypothetical protein
MFFIRKKLPRSHGLNEPIRHDGSHKRPVSRRDFIGAGFMTGPAVVMVPAVVAGLLGNAKAARAALSGDVGALRTSCGIATQGAGKIPFICFDLAGGANLNGSEVLIGGQGGALDFLSTAGYAKLGLPGDMVPNAPNAASANNNFIDTTLGLPWHSDGAILRGILSKTTPAAQANTNGCVIAARSENDTGNNPHNPMYGINKVGADGSLLTLIGSRSSDSGGNSMAPASMIDLSVRPTKVDRASDVTGLVDTGKLGQLFTGPTGASDAVAVLEAAVRITGGVAPTVGQGDPVGFKTKLSAVDMTTRDAAIKETVRCSYVKSADLVDRFATPSTLNPDEDTQIVGSGGIFSAAEYNGDEEFRKTAAVMKMVINGLAGAGTITMGGYDYHDGTRASGEVRNFRAGQCIGAVLEYAKRVGVPVMVYVFSDGSLSATNMVDSSVNGRGKFGWQGDNQSVANSFFLVYSPQGRPQPLAGAGGLPAARHQQIGFYRADGSVETASSPAANAVNLLVETVVLNYMALHGEHGNFPALFPNHGLGDLRLRDGITAFAPIVDHTI